MPDELNHPEIQAAIRAALAEDIGKGDITSLAVIPADTRFSGSMRARHRIVVAGLPIAREVFRAVVPYARFEEQAEDGEGVEEGSILANIEGPARGLLTAERTALNFLQLLSGIATVTRSYVERIEGTGCTLLDTRKTIPGLRRLSKYATRLGGAKNHRMGLFDGVLIKDNHVAVAGGITRAVMRAKSKRASIEVECDTVEQAAEAADAGVNIILLDNMTLDQLRACVQVIGGRAKTEASGGVNLETIRAIAETGVDFVSVGRITQSAPAADIGLDWENNAANF